MTTTNIFEVAVKNKMRFPFRGLISVEDLWDLNVQHLDSIFKELNSQIKQVQEESLLQVKSKEDKELSTKIEIVKYIVDVKLKEEQAKLKEKEVKDQKQKILEVIASKEDESLQNKSADELKAMLEELNK